MENMREKQNIDRFFAAEERYSCPKADFCPARTCRPQIPRSPWIGLPLHEP